MIWQYFSAMMQNIMKKVNNLKPIVLCVQYSIILTQCSPIFWTGPMGSMNHVWGKQQQQQQPSSSMLHTKYFEDLVRERGGGQNHLGQTNQNCVSIFRSTPLWPFTPSGMLLSRGESTEIKQTQKVFRGVPRDLGSTIL